MNRIRLLPEQVANQIAAGEVIERPASVVKELVENSLDAQSESVTVEVQAGGRSLIRVTDDGVGMSRDDALLSFERHATSKIQAADDLARVRTFGFRGEAMPSIASVCRLTLTTRERGQASPEGVRITIHGGRIVEVKAAGCAPGTSVEARSLFFNLPARRKFLRSEETERAHIQHYLTLAALAYPDVAFTFIQDQKLIWQLPAVPSRQGDPLQWLEERLRALYGAGLRWIALDETQPLAAPELERAPPPPPLLRVWGLIGPPGASRATRDEQHLFVNRRPIENRGLNFALLEGYHTALMKGRYPICCLFLEIDPAEVDVNIHPAKREVKFHRENSVRRIVTEAIRNALLQYHRGAKIPATTRPPNRAAIPVPSPERRPPHSGPPSAALAHSSASALATTPAVAPPHPEIFPAAAPDRARRAAAPAAPENERAPTEPIARADESPEESAVRPPAAANASATPLLDIPLRVLGVIAKLYVVMESDRGLVLLDQHAAHERVLYEEMIRRMEQGQAPSQRLLLPESIELSARDAEFLRQNLAAFARLGLGLSEFGSRTFLLDALPPFVKAPEARRFVLEVIDELRAAGTGVNALRLGEQMIAKTVCRHAVKARDPLAGPELEKLVEQLRQCQMPYTCPHGRPTLIEMNFRELEKKFGRSA